MNDELVGRKIRAIEVLQPKCLNRPVDEFTKGLVETRVEKVGHRGKWLFVETTRGYLLLNLGMGGEILLVPRDELPEKWRIRFELSRCESLAVNFWWFGYAHYVESDRLAEHSMTATLGPDALDLSLCAFRRMLAERRARIKSILLDQSEIAGIGNAYVHDILFRAGVHPLRTIPTLSGQDVDRLHAAIRSELRRSIAKGGASYETDLHGRRGGFTSEDLLVGYREGKPCPECSTPIEKIRTGSTSSFICPVCQPLL